MEYITLLEYINSRREICPEIASVHTLIATDTDVTLYRRFHDNRRTVAKLCRRAMLRNGFYGLWLRSYMRDITL